jgi:hypothetical protein
MIFPYSYKGFTVEGFYDEPNQDGRCTFSIYVEHAELQQLCQLVGSGISKWNEAQDLAETVIDELISSWN